MPNSPKFSKKKLIVSGCSYTSNWASTGNLHPFPCWPELLAEKLNMTCINVARCGFGNWAIFSTLLDRMMEEKNIGLVIPMWSEVERVCFYSEKNANPWTWQCFLPARVGRGSSEGDPEPDPGDGEAGTSAGCLRRPVLEEEGSGTHHRCHR